jgi:branched-chain amino acid aminotransferase
MFMQNYVSGRGWHDARIVPFANLSLSPAAVVLHYSQEIFEGTKAYRRPDGGVNLFRPWENAARFNRSATRMAMAQVDVEDHVQAIAKLVDLERDWVPTADGATLYIRPTLIATQPSIGVSVSNEYLHYVILSPVGSMLGVGSGALGVHISDEHVRAVKGGTGAAKTGGNYAAGLVAAEKARSLGYQQVLWLDGVHRKYVEEVGGMNIAIVRGKEIITPALSGSILEGITRDSVLKLAPDLGYPMREETIDVDELLRDIDSGKVSEAFGIGTAAVIAPVGRFGYKGIDHKVGNGNSGPITLHIRKALTDLQYGQAPDPYGWTLKI